MCGIVGYVGRRQAAPILVDSLGRLEYRGYDSAGIAVQNGHGVEVRKLAGRVGALKEEVTRTPLIGTSGIAHTRWATHGAPTTRNAHPHVDCRERVAVVHNGIIENADALRAALERAGHRFRTDTDTETLAHLIEDAPGATLEERVAAAIAAVVGTYGLAVLSADDPGKVVVARQGSPVLLGIGDGEFFVASDAAAVLAHTRSVVYLDDGDLAVLTPDRYHVTDADAHVQLRDVSDIAWDLEAIELGGYPHFMLKEICEQRETVQSTLRGRLLFADGTARLNGLNLSPETCAGINRIVIVACGTSWHAGLEIGVSSTKAFTSQIAGLGLLGLYLGRQRGLSLEAGRAFACRLAQLPALVGQALALEPEVVAIAETFATARNALYLGRGVNFPVALEGALKLKEISYLHAEGDPAAEMKHGPIALIDADMPVVFVAPRDEVYPKVLSNMQEVKARGGRIIAVTTDGAGGAGAGTDGLTPLADHRPCVPAAAPVLSPGVA